MKKSYAKKLGLCVVLALSAGVLFPTGVVEAKNYTAPITGNSRIDGQKTTYKDVLKMECTLLVKILRLKWAIMKLQAGNG